MEWTVEADGLLRQLAVRYTFDWNAVSQTMRCASGFLACPV
jgi:hypothetical protein